MLCRYYYCARPALAGESEDVKLETGGIYTIVLGNTNNEEVTGKRGEQADIRSRLNRLSIFLYYYDHCTHRNVIP